MSISTEAEITMLEEELENLTNSDLDTVRKAEICEELELLKSRNISEGIAEILTDAEAHESKDERRYWAKHEEGLAQEENEGYPEDDNQEMM